MERMAANSTNTILEVLALLQHHSDCKSKIVLMGLLPCGNFQMPPVEYKWPSM
jgi:hypothetical protein